MPGIDDMDDIDDIVYGVWCMVYGIWCMVYGVRRCLHDLMDLACI